MSTKTIRELSLINRIDPRLECLNFSQEKMKWAVALGSAYSNIIQYSASSSSNSNLSFNFNTQGLSTMISRIMYVEVTFVVTLSGTTGGNALITNDGGAPRAYPLASVTDTVNVSINGTSVSMQYCDAFTGMIRYADDYYLTKLDLSSTPTMLDNSTSYNSQVSGLRNPLNSWNNSAYQQGRGCFPATITGNTAGNSPCTITFTVKEPIFLSPLLYASSDPQSAFIGVQNMTVNFNMSDLERCFSWDYALNGITNPVVSAVISGTPKLHVQYLNLPLIEMAQLPKVSMYNYSNVQVYSQGNNSITAGTSGIQVQGPDVPTSTVPKSIIIYVAEQKASRTAIVPDSFFVIQQLSLQFLNVSGQFSSYGDVDLYQMAVKNGYKDSYATFTGTAPSYSNPGSATPLSGSVIKIDSTDLALPSNLASGVPCNSNLQVTVTVKNQATSTRTPYVYVILVNEGVFSISEGAAVSQVSILSQQDVIDCRLKNEWDSMSYYDNNVLGGNLWGKVKSFFKKIGPGIKDALPYIEKYGIPLAKDFMGGEVVGGEVVGGEVVGGKMVLSKGRHRKGGEVVGGKQLSRADLKKMLEY